MVFSVVSLWRSQDFYKEREFLKELVLVVDNIFLYSYIIWIQIEYKVKVFDIVYDESLDDRKGVAQCIYKTTLAIINPNGAWIGMIWIELGKKVPVITLSTQRST